MNILQFYDEMEKRYPKSLSCSWDNDGIMCTPGAVSDIEKILVALDATEEVIGYAAENGFDLVLTHHPMIFSKLASVTPHDPAGRKVIFALMNNITVMSFHTRLDAGENGVNDALAAALGLSEVTAFGDEEAPTLGRIGSLQTPMTLAELAEHVKRALECDSVQLASQDRGKTVRRVAVVGGSGKDFIYAAGKAGADALVTGEVSYNAMLDAAEDGIAVISAGHFHTENPVCKTLAETAKQISGAYVEIYNSNMIYT